MITDARGIIVDVNQALCAATGYRANELVGRSPRLLRSGRHADGFYTAMWSGLTAHGRWSGEIWNRHKDGELIPFLLSISAVADERGGAGHYVAFYSSIRAQKAQQRQLERVAHFDPLTELPNRVLLADRLQQAMAQATRRGTRLAVVYLDLDGFKEVNDSHGHDVGDQLLLHLGERMQQVLRTTDTIARLGGDEFVAVLIDLEPEDDGSLMLGRLLECVARPLWLDGLELRVSASIGVSFYPQDEEVDAERLLRQADQAMYRSKLAGKNRFSVYEPGRDRALRGRIEDLGRVRQALDAGEFELFYQPKVNLRSGAVIGYEALLRWHHPEQGLLHPEEFLPPVEGSELDLELGEWVLGAVLAQLGAWSGSRLERPISLNLSAHQLRHAGFLEMLRRRLAQAPGVDPGQLGLEIVSAGGGGELTRVTRVMEACRSLGIALALDDFGAGYSALSSLKQLPVGLIKVDRTFVSQMLDDSENLAIVEGVLALAAAFQRATLAEGVETVEHGRVLLQLGCELAQGYGIARPIHFGSIP
ncbi:MAG: EAL domain-containing protein [Candidatus Sedimenticola endophacoides]